MKAWSHAVQRITGRSLIAIGLTLFAMGEAHAGVPSPANSTCPSVVTVAADGTCCFDVVVRDFAGIPIPGATVVVDFGTCAVSFCPAQPPGITVIGNTVLATTNALGVARFCICATFTPACTASIYADGVLLCTVPVGNCEGCRNNLVSNGDFSAGLVYGSMPAGSVTDWSLLTASPQVVSDGCAAPGSIQMWGNKVVGESIKQALPGLGIEAGKKYSVTVCYRWLDNNPLLPQYVRFRLAVSGAAPAGYPPISAYDLIGVTPNTSSTSWSTYTFPVWTAPNNASWLTVNPENDETLNDGAYVSWGLIDDICIEWVNPTPTQKSSWGKLKVLYR